MKCNEVQDHLSPHLEDHLGPTERAAVAEHLLACPTCRALRDEMRELLVDLRRLSVEQALPEGLDERILARVPAARRRGAGRRSARSVTWQRAAVWAFVFLGAWWQLVGTQLSTLAADEVAPVAAELVADAKQATLRRSAEWMPSDDFELSLSKPVGQAGQSLASFSRALHRALFVPESQPTPTPQTRPAGVPQGDLQP